MKHPSAIKGRTPPSWPGSRRTLPGSTALDSCHGGDHRVSWPCHAVNLKNGFWLLCGGPKKGWSFMLQDTQSRRTDGGWLSLMSPIVGK